MSVGFIELEGTALVSRGYSSTYRPYSHVTARSFKNCQRLGNYYRQNQIIKFIFVISSTNSHALNLLKTISIVSLVNFNFEYRKMFFFSFFLTYVDIYIYNGLTRWSIQLDAIQFIPGNLTSILWNVWYSNVAESMPWALTMPIRGYIIYTTILLSSSLVK